MRRKRLTNVFLGRHVHDVIDFVGVCSNAILAYDMTQKLDGTLNKFTLVV